MNFINKLERKFGRFAIQNLSIWIIGAYVVGYTLLYMAPQLLGYLLLDPYMIFRGGEVWRLITWVVTPPGTSNVLLVAIMMLFYYSLGTSLERTWGAFRYNLYIFSGFFFTVLGCIIMYFILGQPLFMGAYFSTYYINLSIFLAFAALYPDMQVMLYFLIPVKIKWLAYLDVALLGWTMVSSDWVTRVAIVVSLLNFILFFFSTRNYKTISPKEFQRRRAYRQQTAARQNVTKHRCAVCGRTEKDGDHLEFRFCSKCEGNYEYCQDHLFTHQHVKQE